jgi:hypothetical protein
MLPTINRIKDITGFEHGVRAAIRGVLGGEQSKKDCGKCPQTVWINVFFDGTGNNFREDGMFYSTEKSKQSNIAKLAFFAWQEHTTDIFTQNMAKASYRIYVPGVGTPFPEIGDAGWASEKLGNVFSWYGDERLNWTMERLKQAVANHAPLVKRINVSIFGFSRGATLARAFAHRLGKECEQRENRLIWKTGLLGKECPLEIYFMGVLDTVASVGFGGSRMETQIRNSGKYSSVVGFLLFSYVDKGGHHGWASDLSIPPYVTQCVHYVAAHECREKFPFDSVQQMQAMPTNAHEVFYPGMHSDIGGGYLPTYQEGRTSELARIALNNLYRDAWMAGVPLRSPADIDKTYPGLFDISPELEACFNEYMRGLTDGGLQHQVMQHMDRYYSWRCGRMRRLADKTLSPPGGVDPHMAITDKEFAADVQEIAEKKTGYIRLNTEQHEDVIYREYHKAGIQGYRARLASEQQQKFDLLFDKYVHDSIAGMKEAIGFLEKSRYTYNRCMFVGKQDDRCYLWRYKGFLPATATFEKQAKNAPEKTDVEVA